MSFESDQKKLINRITDNTKVIMLGDINKSEEDIFKEAYDECEGEDISNFDLEGFVDYCESFYNMTTDEFHKWFKENDYEGDPTQKMWYLFTKDNETN